MLHEENNLVRIKREWNGLSIEKVCALEIEMRISMIFQVKNVENRVQHGIWSALGALKQPFYQVQEKVAGIVCSRTSRINMFTRVKRELSCFKWFHTLCAHKLYINV